MNKKHSSAMFILGVMVCFLTLYGAAQETPNPDFLTTPPPETLSPQQMIQLTATQIVANYDATATAYPVSEEQVDTYGAFVFILAFGSLLIVFVPLAFGVWWMNRGK